MDTRAKLASIVDAIAASFPERRGFARLLVLGAIAGENVCVLSEPGCAKSAIVRAFASCIDGAGYFEHLFSKFTTEDEVMGPLKATAYLQDRVERSTAGMMPEAHLAFCDEVFKSNGPMLNVLLSVLNERTYRAKLTPLRFVVGASNELPEDPDALAALWDRWLLRDTLEYVKDADVLADLLVTAAARGVTFAPPCKLALDEWAAAMAEARRLPLPRHLAVVLTGLVRDLRAQGVAVSDRRAIKAVGVLQAAAWLDGSAEVYPDHLGVLRYVLWAKPEDRPLVDAALARIDAGPVTEARAITDEALRAWEGRPASPAALYDAAPGIQAQFDRSFARLNELWAVASGRAQEQIAPMYGEINAAKALLDEVWARRYAGGAK